MATDLKPDLGHRRIGMWAGRLVLPALLAVGILWMLEGSTIWQQVSNERCVAEALNRVTEVGPDGSFTINNIPADQRLIRARVTCTDETSARGGLSGFFAAVPNGVVNLGNISVGPLQPRVLSLRATASPATLSSAGASSQITALATLGDGSTKNVDGAANGTSYTTSNPAVCQVNADGRVFAAAQGGSCLITATHEGVVATVAIAVQLGDDADGDGLPDEYEARFACLNGAANDAGGDPDADGLTNQQEFGRGTSPCVADTDGDGLKDGDEVQRGTDPLNPDTDFDGVVDGVEVQLGTDPLSPSGDADNDGLPDSVEIALVGNATGADPNADADTDGLTNRDEVDLGTNPRNRDTDGDGLTDGDEIARRTDPMKIDTDGDSFTDGEEVLLGSDPLDRNSRPNVQTVKEAVGPIFTIENAENPGQTAIREAVGPIITIENSDNPGQSVVREAVGPIFTIENSDNPSQSTIREAVGPIFTIENSDNPGQTAIKEAVGPILTIENAGNPGQQPVREAVGPLTTIRNQGP